MSGITSMLRAAYVKFMVWLGAAPPPNFEHLLPDETGARHYTLRPGDTFGRVARRFKVHPTRLAQANGITDPGAVQPGQAIAIPPESWDPSQGPLTQLQPPREEPPQLHPDDETETPAPVKPIEGPPPKTEPAEIVTEEAPRSALIADEPPAADPAAVVTQFEGELAWLVAAQPDAEAAPTETADDAALADDLQWLLGQTTAPAVEDVEEAAPPAVEPPPAEEATPSEEKVFRYTVQRGDTLGGIAKRYGVSINSLLAANDITNPNLLFPGQKLVIPGYAEPQKDAPIELPDFPKPVERVTPVEPVDDGPFEAYGSPTARRGLYVSYFAIGHPEVRNRIFDLITRTELNTLVIDIKGDHGWISYPTQVQTAQEIGAARPSVRDFEDIVAQLKSDGIHLIGRLVTFKDNLLARAQPGYAVKTADAMGDAVLWTDRDRLAWCDPFLQPVWEYNIQLAVEAAELGFSEIQFDAIRFPTASQGETLRYVQEESKQSRVTAITSFLSAAKGQLDPLNIKVGARTFGYTCWRKDDMLIGQDIERIAQYVDVLSPMLYPSSFGNGIPGYQMSVAHPYEVVFESARRAVERVGKFECEVRPWIQDFPDYRFDKRVYGRAEIQQQIKGCFDAGGSGYMVWDPKGGYTTGAYAPAAEPVSL